MISGKGYFCPLLFGPETHRRESVSLGKPQHNYYTYTRFLPLPPPTNHASQLNHRPLHPSGTHSRYIQTSVGSGGLAHPVLPANANVSTRSSLLHKTFDDRTRYVIELKIFCSVKRNFLRDFSTVVVHFIISIMFI